MYFKEFPNIYYLYNIKGQEVLTIVKDITQNVRVRKEILENITLYDEYDIKEGETPEIVSDRVYGSPLYHWVIMIVNGKYNYAEDWPLSYHQFEAYILDKYGSIEQASEIHHWEKDGFIVESDVIDAQAITFYQYEQQQNDNKRRIKLISPEILTKVLDEFRVLM